MSGFVPESRGFVQRGGGRRFKRTQGGEVINLNIFVIIIIMEDNPWFSEFVAGVVPARIVLLLNWGRAAAFLIILRTS